MPRKYAVLKQFTQDLDRLLREAEAAFATLRSEVNPAQAQILALYRPVHSLKGICGMVEETKLLVRAFHALEDRLPPLVPIRTVKNGPKTAESSDWTTVATATFRMAREVERLLLAKLELWQRLGADDNEARGLLIAFTHEGAKIRAWVGITALVGLVDAAEVRESGVVGRVGSSHEALLVDLHEGPVAVYFDEIEATCTRPEAAGKGAPAAFKEWWAAYQRASKSSAA